MSSINGALKEVGRYHLRFIFNNLSRSGHIITAERLANGEIRIYDPQSGKILKDFNGFNVTVDENTFEYYRVDDLLLNPKIIKGVVKPSKAKGDSPIIKDRDDWNYLLGKGWFGAEDIDKKLKQLRISKGKEAISIQRELIKDDSFEEIKKGVKSVVNKNDPDYIRLLNGADKAVEHGYNVFILPNPKGIRSADFILTKNHFIGVYDLKTVMGKNSVSTQLIDSIGQANRIILNIATNYNSRQLAKDIRRYFEMNKEAKEVMIFKGKRRITITRKNTINSNFINNFALEYNRKN